MSGQFHEVVKLLLKRMESHPEEFEVSSVGERDIVSDHDRWWCVMDKVLDHGTDEEKAAIRAALREIKLNAAHKIMMDELLNGDERRTKRQEEETTYERNLLLKHSLAQQQQVLQQSLTVPNTQQLQTVIDNYTPHPWENNGLVATIRKGLRIK